MLRSALARQLQRTVPKWQVVGQQQFSRMVPVSRCNAHQFMQRHVLCASSQLLRHSSTSAKPSSAVEKPSSSSAKPRKLPRPPPPPEDGLTRYPSFSSPQGVLRGLDLFGTVVFAYSGCVTAGNCGMDLLGCMIVGTVTAVGGGTIRDVFLGNVPVFWMTEVEVRNLS
jgi:Glycine transporter